MITEKRKEYMKNYKKVYRQTHKEEIRTYRQTYKQTHGEAQEKQRGYNGKYRKSPKGQAAKIRANIKRRTRLTSVETILLQDVVLRDRGLCQLCREPINLEAHYLDNLAPTLDHIIPLSKGGNHTMDNIQLAHRICNLLKHDNEDKHITWDEWQRYGLRNL